MAVPTFGQPLDQEQIAFFNAFAKSCRHSILEMTKNSQSGHPGGSLSSLDYLALLYAFVISQTGESVIVSHGHISPAVYSVLGELGYIDKEDVVQNFRKVGTIWEGHITRHVPGVLIGTGPLGVGVSAATGFALAERLKKSDQKVYALMGDGETQEGQVHEMIHFARHYALDNFVLFVDYNKVQLTASIEETLNIDIKKVFEAGHWHIIEADAHDPESIWNAISEAQTVTWKPVVILGHSIMGKGVKMMEEDGQALKPTWHGKAPNPDDAVESLLALTPTPEEVALIEDFKKDIKWRPQDPFFEEDLEDVGLNLGTPIVYEPGSVCDCRGAYGKALLDLAKHNPQVLALTADLGSSVMTKFVHQELPEQHFECGIAEQHMVSVSGGLSLEGFIPFCSTFGAFMSSRAKDQARVNDINRCNVKMVSTHCGLSVGEDGPTHQAIDDAGSFLGMFHTRPLEPCDANQTDRLIRYVASHYGNFYVRMGRHKMPVILKEDGTVFYGPDYEYKYGRCDVIREGEDLTIVAIGSMVNEALKAREILAKTRPHISVEIVAATSIKKFDQTLQKSIEKTEKVLTVEDHNTYSGLGGQLARYLESNGIAVTDYKMLGVTEYQLSGKHTELYELAGISPEKIAKACVNLTL
ncbi:transketolase [Candidatus Peregrinibacteria bacterium]|jgi:transketolase|nr:transketolase [Candidatus Peregrinibacteria bacterium]